MIKRLPSWSNSAISVKSISFELLDKYLGVLLWCMGERRNRKYYDRIISHIKNMWNRNGKSFLVTYLKECTRILQHHISGNNTNCIGIRVGTRGGLPLILPGPIRYLILARDEKTIRIVLSILSLFRVIAFKGKLKLSTITDPFSGLDKTLPVGELGNCWARLFQPKFNQLPFPRGLDSLLILKSAGPNYRTSILGAPLDAKAFIDKPNLLNSLITISRYFKSSIGVLLQEEIEVVREIEFTKVLKLGKLAIKEEAAGKVRVFAITDVWTQSVLQPIHSYIFDFLSKIRQDGTFNQAQPIYNLMKTLKGRTDKSVWSFDLSAATDRLPIDLQVQLLSQLFEREVADAWKELLVGREWELDSKLYGKHTVMYSVGQPMGALSSWAMLALTHHFIVQIAASRAGFNSWFEDYALLGDDIVIANREVSTIYLSIMKGLGVEINLSKSLVSSDGVIEFAKRLVSPESEYSPVGPKNLLWAIKTPSMIPSVFLDLVGKGFKLDLQAIDEMFHDIDPALIKLSKSGQEKLLWSIVGPFGMVKEARGFTSERIANHLSSFQLYYVLEAIKRSMIRDSYREFKKAEEKTLDSISKLLNKESYPFLTNITDPTSLPSWRNLTMSSAEMYFDLLEKSPLEDREGGLTSHPAYLTGVYDPGILTINLLRIRPVFSPLDNCLVKPKLVKPRIRDVNLKFYDKVHKELKKGVVLW